MSIKLRRGLYANIASTAGVILALGGTAYASTLVTSAQIQDGTIKNRDIHAETIDGSRVLDGSIGRDDLSPDVRSAAYSSYHDAPVTITGSVATVLSLTIPRSGSYVVNAKVEGYSTASASAWLACYLVGPGASDSNIGSLVANGAAGIPLQIVDDFAGGETVLVRCYGSGASGIDARWTKITAVSVDSLTNTPG
jgi:hypothetical protein